MGIQHAPGALFGLRRIEIVCRRNPEVSRSNLKLVRGGVLESYSCGLFALQAIVIMPARAADWGHAFISCTALMHGISECCMPLTLHLHRVKNGGVSLSPACMELMEGAVREVHMIACKALEESMGRERAAQTQLVGVCLVCFSL